MRRHHALMAVLLVCGCIMATAPESTTTSTSTTTTTIPLHEFQRFDGCNNMTDNETARQECFLGLLNDFNGMKLCDDLVKYSDTQNGQKRKETCIYFAALASKENTMCDGIDDPTYAERCKIDVDPSSVKCNCTNLVNRVLLNESDEALIMLAENTSCPNGRWWYGDAETPRSMKCVNADTLKYYQDMLVQLGQNASYLGAPTVMSYVKYDAAVSRRKNNGQYSCAAGSDELNIVNLNLEYFVSCGQYCGQGQKHFRNIVFNSTHQVCAIEGDDVDSITFVP